MATARWMEQCKSAPIADVLAETGLQKKGSGYGPCPVCGAEKRSSSDKRAPVFPGSGHNGWKCISCDAKGDTLNLVGQTLFKSTLRDLQQEDRWKVREWFAARKWCDPYGQEPSADRKVAPPPKIEDTYAPQDEVQSLWEACLPTHQDGQAGGIDMDAARFFQTRGWNSRLLADANVARLTPHPDAYAWPEWWPKGRAGLWRLVVPAYTAKGELRSIHGRAIARKDDWPKQLWPKNCSALKLIMADPQGQRMLARKAKPKRIIICEGITDLVSVSMYKRFIPESIAVLSCASGGFAALRDVHWPAWVPIYVATDEGDKDGKGDAYAQEVATYVAPHPVRRLPLSRFLNT